MQSRLVRVLGGGWDGGWLVEPVAVGIPGSRESSKFEGGLRMKTKSSLALAHTSLLALGGEDSVVDEVAGRSGCRREGPRRGYFLKKL